MEVAASPFLEADETYHRNCSNPDNLILDSFSGSGTTEALAHKMNRLWIMIELDDHCRTHIIPRLQKAIDGQDPGGITSATNWQGGGFRYYHLAPSLLGKRQVEQLGHQQNLQPRNAR